MASLRWLHLGGLGLVATALGCGAILGLTDPTVDDNLVLDGGSDGPNRPDAVTGPDGCVSCSTTTCTDFKNDSKNCGTCGRTCDNGGACTNGLCAPLKLQTVSAASHIYVDATHLYYSDLFSMHRVPTSAPTGPASNLESATSAIRGFAVTGTDLYLNIGGGVDGSNVLTPSITKHCPTTGCPGANGGVEMPTNAGIAGTMEASKSGIYFWDIYNGGLKRCAYPECAGGMVPPGNGGYAVGGIAIGTEAVYYTDDSKNGTGQGVYACDLAGCQVKETQILATPSPIGLALGEKLLYAAELFKGTIIALPRQGNTGDPADVASGLNAPVHVAVDAKYVYWAEQGTVDGTGHSKDGRIARCPIGMACGTNFETLAANLDWAIDVAVDANYVYFVTAGDDTIWRLPK